MENEKKIPKKSCEYCDLFMFYVDFVINHLSEKKMFRHGHNTPSPELVPPNFQGLYLE